jgi:Ni,Fe-hydrogenase maturation factor
VVFVDAGIDTPEDVVELRPLGPKAVRGRFGHISDPQELLTLTQEVYGHCPSAWLLTVPATRVEFGEGLSHEAQRRAEQALARLAQWLQDTGEPRTI